MNQAKSVVPKRVPAIPSEILGMLIFIFTEIMFFTALMSAYIVIKKEGLGWAPPENIKLPIMTTAFNTLVLFLSGFFFVLAERSYSKSNKDKTLSFLSLAALLGGAFVMIQGYEWIQLLKFGMSMKSSIFGATFFLLIGSHGLHAFCGIVALYWGYFQIKKGQMSLNSFRALGLFWALIVLVWPFLYKLVYF